MAQSIRHGNPKPHRQKGTRPATLHTRIRIHPIRRHPSLRGRSSRHENKLHHRAKRSRCESRDRKNRTIHKRRHRMRIHDRNPTRRWAHSLQTRRRRRKLLPHALKRRNRMGEQEAERCPQRSHHRPCSRPRRRRLPMVRQSRILGRPKISARRNI